MGKKSRARRRAERAQERMAEFLNPDQAAVNAALMQEEPIIIKGERVGTIMHYRDATTGQYVGQEKPKVNAALVASIRRQMQENTDVRMAPCDPAEMTKEETIVMAGNGIFRYIKTKVGFVCALAHKDGVKAMPDQPEEHIRFVPAFPLLPWNLLGIAVAFLKWVKETHDTEGLVRFYFNTEKQEWAIHVPNQQVSGAAAVVAQDEPDPGLGEFAMEIHSHPGSSSVFSGTDDDNEQMQRIFGCVADLKGNDTPNFHWRIGTGRKLWQDVTTPTVVNAGEPILVRLSPAECLKEKFSLNPFKDYVFPEEWKSRVNKEAARGYTVHYPSQDRRVTGRGNGNGSGPSGADTPIVVTDKRRVPAAGFKPEVNIPNFHGFGSDGLFYREGKLYTGRLGQKFYHLGVRYDSYEEWNELQEDLSVQADRLLAEGKAGDVIITAAQNKGGNGAA